MLVKKLFTNSFTLAVILLIAFRICLYFIGWEEDGNLLILVVLPLLVFWGIIQVIKNIYRHKKSS